MRKNKLQIKGIENENADVVKLVYTLALGASAARRESSSLSIRTVMFNKKTTYAKKRILRNITGRVVNSS